MTPPIFRPAAAADVEDAYRWYEAQRTGLGEEFLAAVGAAMASMAANPEQFPVLHRETRRALLQRFPYGLYYRIISDQIVVWRVCMPAGTRDGGKLAVDNSVALHKTCYKQTMAGLKGLKGMRHLALNVTDVRRSKAFYREIFGMEVVWEPDPKNVYLSSGVDNVALHEVAAGTEPQPAPQKLDHLGFIVDGMERVRELERDFIDRGVKIIHPFKIHRDGSASFYCSDPDGIVIQLLYEPTLSRQEIT